MKKIFTFPMIGVVILNIFFSTAYAENLPSTAFINNCDMVIHDYGSNFMTVDGDFFASLYYNSRKGNSVSGVVINAANGNWISADLIESSCQESTVTLKWNTPDFKGSLTGKVNVRTQRIENVTGIIDDLPVNTTLIGIG